MNQLIGAFCAAILLSGPALAGEPFAEAQKVQDADSRPGNPPPDLAVPKEGWASLKPNPAVLEMKDNSWMILPTQFRPERAPSFGTFQFGADYRKFGHPKTEVCLVYDEARNVTIWFGGCSSGYTNQTLLLSVSDGIWYQAQPEHIDLITGKTRHARERPHGQCSYGACYDPFAKVYLKGMGICSGWPYDLKLWAYDAGKNQWQEMAPWQTGGTGRTGCYKLVYDRMNKVVVLFGGLPLQNEDTWTFDVAQRRWEKVSIRGPRPRGRLYHHMVYDEKNQKTVLFGGAGGTYSNKVYLDDTWVFDAAAKTWTEMKPRNHPPARYMGAMAYDAANGVSILIGGKAENRERPFADTWVYDLANNEWREMKPANQPAYYGLYQAAYDRINNVTVYVSAGKTYLYRYAGSKPKG
jgi:hypothetical protein